MRALSRIQSDSQPRERPPWRRDVRLLALSRGISVGGAEAGHIALLALAWNLTGSASQASLVLIASVVARTATAPLAGWIGDRLPRRRVIIASELGMAATLASMALAQSMTQLVALCMVHAFAASTCGAALDAALPNLVPQRELARANATLGMARTAGGMLGPVLGGLAIAAFGPRSAFFIDAGSSVIAAVVVLGIAGTLGGGGARRSSESRIPDEHPGMLAGMRVLATDPILRLMAAAWTGICVCFGFVTAAELPLAIEFGADEAGLGAIITCWCIGALLGSWHARRIKVERGGARVLALNALACAVVFSAVGFVPEFWNVLVLMAIGGFSMSLANVVEMTLLQSRIPDEVRARTLAAYHGLFSVVWGVNIALAGLFIDAFSARAAYIYAGVWCLVGVVGFIAVARALKQEQHSELVLHLRPRHALESPRHVSESELARGA